MQTDVAEQLARDLALLGQAEQDATGAFRLWTTQAATVVLGRSVDAGEEVDEDFCARAGIAIVRRPSGGRSVLVGPGTLQYAFALPYSLAAELSTIPASKRFCNRLLVPALESAAGIAAGTLQEDRSGDVLLGDRKVAGLALRRRRTAMLLHGTILVRADLALIARALRHPACEPAYRRGRAHEDFLANLGRADESMLERTVRELLRRA
jgi:lipoate-protein ligase A